MARMVMALVVAALFTVGAGAQDKPAQNEKNTAQSTGAKACCCCEGKDAGSCKEMKGTKGAKGTRQQMKKNGAKADVKQ